MASLITCTPGGAQDNSYVDLTDADLYFKDSLSENDWKSNSDPERERALISATKVIENLGGNRTSDDTGQSSANRPLFRGFPATDDQTLFFSRITDLDDAGLVVPRTVREAVCEQAIYMLSERKNPDPLPIDRMRDAGLTTISLDGISTSWQPGRRSSGIAPAAWQLIKPYVSRVRPTRVGTSQQPYYTGGIVEPRV